MTDEAQAPTTAPSESPKKNFGLLAKEMFGNDYYGEVSELEPAPQESPNEPDEMNLEEPETPDAPETAAPEQPEAPETAEEEETISSFDELLKHSELDPDWAYGLEVPVKVDGAEGKAKLSDLVRSYQTVQAAEKRLNDAKERVKELNQVWQALPEVVKDQQKVQAQIHAAAEIIKEAESLLVADESGINWSKLREQDPAEWAARKAEFAERRKKIQQLKDNASAAYDGSLQNQQKMSDAQLYAVQQEEIKRLYDAIPEWSDGKRAESEKAGMSKYLVDAGLTAEELKQILDHRFFVLARKAMLYDQTQSKAEPALKKLKKVPKVLKPGAPKPPEQLSREKAQGLLQRVRETGDEVAAIAYLKAKRQRG